MFSSTAFNLKLVPPNITDSSEFVKYLANNCKHKRNVTDFSRNMSSAIHKFSRGSSNDLNLLSSTTDNLERIRKYKETECYKDLLKKNLAQQLPRLSLSVDSPPKNTASNLEKTLKTDMLRKNARICGLLKEKGNEFYKERKLDEALRCYTLACSYAPKDTRQEGLAFSNRSACFFEMGNFKKCLEDIETFKLIWASKPHDDDPKSEIVMKRMADRKLKCLEKMKKYHYEAENEDLEFVKELLKLKCPSKEFPVAESFVGVRKSDQKGRHVINAGKETIVPGTLIMLEKPYAHVLMDAFLFRLQHCSACLKDLGGGGVPCGGCVFAVYCSQECATSPHHQVHSQFECKLSPYLYEFNMNKTMYLATKIMLQLTPQEFLSQIRSAKPNTETEDNQVAASYHYDISSYQSSIGELIWHNETWTEEIIQSYCATSLVMTDIVDAGTDYFKSICENEGEIIYMKDEFAKLLLTNRLSLACNAEYVEKMNVPLKNPKMDQIKHASFDKICSALYPLISKMNHSCDPNTAKEGLVGGVKAVIATQHILPGEEIFTSYRSHFIEEPDREVRRRKLKEDYNFECDCLACKLDWGRDPPGESGVVQMMMSMGLFGDKDTVLICSKCRMNLSYIVKGYANLVLQKIGLEKFLMCPICGQKALMQECKNESKRFVMLHEMSFVTILMNAPKKGFVDALKCLTYFDGNFKKPSSFVTFSQENLKQALSLMTRKMFL